MKRVFSVAMLIVGTVVGAGFASGREIVAFFGETPPASVPAICAALIFAMSLVFLSVGRAANRCTAEEVNVLLAGRFAPAISVIMIFNGVISLAAMLAGFDSLFGAFLPVRPLFSAVMAVVSSLIVAGGIKNMVRANVVLVPLLAAAIALVALLSVSAPAHSALTPALGFGGLSYVAMNMLLASSVLVTVRGLSVRETVLSSLLAAVILGALMQLISAALGSSAAGQSDMPLLAMASALNPALYAFAVTAVSAGIFTTMLTAHRSLTDWAAAYTRSRPTAAFSTAAVCLALSLLGFRNIVDYAYPLVGAAGLVYFVLAAAFLFRGAVARRKPLEQAHAKVHKPRKRAKNNG